MRTSTIVVGTDGTASSEAAVRWAAAEAARREVPLRIVHAYDAEHDHSGLERQFAQAALDAAIRQARKVAPAVRIEERAPAGDPVHGLLGAGADALIVLGNRGRGGFASLLLGSVSQRVATHASGPVVIVRGRTEVAGGPVVAGVDDSAAADGVLAAAFDAAASQGCSLAVVRTYAPPTPLWVGDIPVVDGEAPVVDAARQRDLEALVAPWRDKYPQVDAEVAVSPDGPAAVLVALSHSARLVVVGSRGHGTLAGTLLGSTGLQLLHHAGCPVLIERGPQVASIASGHDPADR